MDFTKTCEFPQLPPNINNGYIHSCTKDGKVRRFPNKKVLDWKEEIGWAFKSGRNVDREGRYGVEVFIEMGDKRKRDVDSGIKFILDSLSGIIWEDDNQVSEVHIYKERTDEHRTVISVYQLT